MADAPAPDRNVRTTGPMLCPGRAAPIDAKPGNPQAFVAASLGFGWPCPIPRIPTC